MTGALYTCPDCGQEHRDERPDECQRCGSDGDDLEWSYRYAHPGRFA